jgi:hypothetical protein
MKRIAVFVLLAVAGLAACEAGAPTAAEPTRPLALVQPIDEPIQPISPEPIEPIEPIEPGDTTTYPPDTTTYQPPVVEYRISVGLYRSGGDMKAFTRFERGYNGSFTQVNASNLSVHCYVNGVFRDGETEYNAGYTHITFGESYRYGKQIVCHHSANSGAYTATTSYTM